jgi:hypothetical protein
MLCPTPSNESQQTAAAAPFGKKTALLGAVPSTYQHEVHDAITSANSIFENLQVDSDIPTPRET